MDQATIRRAFNREYNGQPNVMTPTITRYRNLGPLLVEYSKGPGIEPGTTMYGYTALLVVDEPQAPDGYQTKRMTQYCECFRTVEERERHHKKVRDETHSLQRTRLPKAFR
jgi:hypothetical protein